MASAWKAENPRLGTVGCVALDARGGLADLVGDGAPLAAAALRVLQEVGPGAGLVAIDGGAMLVEERTTPFMATARRSS